MYIYIRAMSEYQAEIYRKLSDITDEIDCHIIRLMMYPHASVVSHWKQEVFGFLPRIKKLKNTKKFPTTKFILKGLQTSNDMIDTLIYQVKHMEKDLTPIDISESDALKAIEEYQNWIAQELSTKGFVMPDDVYTKLTEITGCD